MGGSRDSAGRLSTPASGNAYLQVFSPTPERAGLANISERCVLVGCSRIANQNVALAFR
jgi:hypothetical protein